MPSLKEVRVRIASVKSTRQITSAMKMVSASKLRRAQNAILSMRPYATKLQEIMSNLSRDMEGSDEGVWVEDRGANKVLIVAITSNRGLCGAFNANVAKAVVRILADDYKTQYDNGNVDIMCLGKKGADALKSVGMKPVEINTEIFDKLDFDHTEEIARGLMADFLEKKYDKIMLIYNQFKNAAVQILQEEQFLPLVESDTVSENQHQATEANFIFEPNKEEILEALVPSSIKIQLYKALLDSHAAEHGARMTAMHKATENADELLKDLKLSYNKARQASITNEILEIVSGAEALKG
jgi:F-type H+-transporting ATPase subunit gamma